MKLKKMLDELENIANRHFDNFKTTYTPNLEISEYFIHVKQEFDISDYYYPKYEIIIDIKDENDIYIDNSYFIEQDYPDSRHINTNKGYEREVLKVIKEWLLEGNS